MPKCTPIEDPDSFAKKWSWLCENTESCSISTTGWKGEKDGCFVNVAIKEYPSDTDLWEDTLNGENWNHALDKAMDYVGEHLHNLKMAK